MLSSGSANLNYLALEEIITAGPEPADGIAAVHSALKEMFVEVSSESGQFFTNFYTRAIYIFDQYEFPEELRSRIIALNFFTGRLARNRLLFCSHADFMAAAAILAESTERLSGEVIPSVLKIKTSEYYQTRFTFEKVSRPGETADFLRAIVTDRGEYNKSTEPKKESALLVLSAEDGHEITMRMYGRWAQIWRLVHPGSTLNIFAARASADREDYYVTTSDTLIVLEPDYLIDVTHLAECFGRNGASLAHYLFKKFQNGSIGAKMVLGNMVNYFFDALIEDPDAQFDVLYENALKSRPMQIFALAIADPDGSRRLRTESAMHFQRLREIIPEIIAGHISVEPSFISPCFGLQGRLDALIEYDADPRRKNIIELKSGRAPATSLYIKGDDGAAVPIAIWSNHIAQATCYNMLLDSTFAGRTGNSQILYSSTSDYPLRNAPNIMRYKREVAMFRNFCVAADLALVRGKYSMLDRISPARFGDMPPYLEGDVSKFARIYDSLDESERLYFHIYIKFIQSEILFGKTGDGANGSAGFASLWRDPIAGKYSSSYVIPDMRLDSDGSDFGRGYLKFIRTDGEDAKTIRRGDLAVLYPTDADGNSLLLRNQIVKGTVKSIDSGGLVLSLRNKMSRREFYSEYERWNLEPDRIDATSQAMFRSLYGLMEAAPEKRRMIMGLLPPRFADNEIADRPELNEIQNELLKKAVNARDYFLVQGPPGTGKTSYMLRAIVDHIHKNSDENILLLAYTNRACDEICSALKTIEPAVPFVRAGYKESSEHTDKLISMLSESMDFRELFLLVKKSRIVVATVSTALTSSEIFDLKHFHTMIIDEASQILEPQIVGIIARADRFIMIGDERQLPAIVTQSNEQCEIEDESLLNIGLGSTAGSLFERLAARAASEKWPDASGMLRRQARMHEDIQRLANEMFYGGGLMTFPDIARQHAKDDKISEYGSTESVLIARSRTLYIDSERESGSKVHHAEARRAAQIAGLVREIYGTAFDENTVGIISPFRAQCAEIRRRLGPELAGMVAVDTVERYQGSQRDIIIISLAVNYPGQLEMISRSAKINGSEIDRKLNVAITRARERVIVLGRRELLSKSPAYSQMIDIISGAWAAISHQEFDAEFNNKYL